MKKMKEMKEKKKRRPLFICVLPRFPDFLGNEQATESCM